MCVIFRSCDFELEQYCDLCSCFLDDPTILARTEGVVVVGYAVPCLA